MRKGVKAETNQILLTPAEVAQILRLGKNKTYELIATGVIPCVRFGRAIRVPRRALENWIQGEATSLRTK